MTAAYNKFNIFVQDVTNAHHNCGTDALKIMLTNTLPVAANAVYADVSATELATGNGYTTGGSAATQVSNTQTSGTDTLTCNNVTFTATGAMGPFRYAILYNTTSVTPLKPLIAWWDYGSSLTLQIGDTFTVAFNSGTSSGSVFTLA